MTLLLTMMLLFGSPDGRPYDLRILGEAEALGRLVSDCSVRVESERKLPPPFDPDIPSLQDGGAVVLGRGRLLTTARYLEGASAVFLVTREGARVPARVVRLDPEADLAVLTVPEQSTGALTPVAGLEPFPLGTGAEGEVVLPSSLVGQSISIRRAFTGRDDEGVDLVTGATANGVPLFDTRGHLVGLSRFPTADRASTLVVPGEAIRAWLRGEDGEESGPRTGVREPGGP